MEGWALINNFWEKNQHSQRSSQIDAYNVAVSGNNALKRSLTNETAISFSGYLFLNPDVC